MKRQLNQKLIISPYVLLLIPKCLKFCELNTASQNPLARGFSESNFKMCATVRSTEHFQILLKIQIMKIICVYANNHEK